MIRKLFHPINRIKVGRPRIKSRFSLGSKTERVLRCFQSLIASPGLGVGIAFTKTLVIIGIIFGMRYIVLPASGGPCGIMVLQSPPAVLCPPVLFAAPRVLLCSSGPFGLPGGRCCTIWWYARSLRVCKSSLRYCHLHFFLWFHSLDIYYLLIASYHHMFFLLSLLEAPADANCFGWWARCAMGQTMHLSDFMDVAADGYFSMSFNAEQVLPIGNAPPGAHRTERNQVLHNRDWQGLSRGSQVVPIKKHVLRVFEGSTHGLPI